MKIKPSFMLKKILDDYIVIPTGETLLNFDAMITLNETGAFLWEQLQQEQDKEKLVDALCKEYEVTREQADDDVSHFITMLEQSKVLEC